MNQKILVTGATGFLGKSLLGKLRKKYQNVVGLARHAHDTTTVVGDLRDLASLKKLIRHQKPDVIFHLAANVNLDRSYEVSKQCIDNNLVSTLNLLEALKEYTPAKVIFSSTEEVYGHGPVPFRENQSLDPPSMYAITKVAGENLLKIYSGLLGFTGIVVRIATFYGPLNHKDRFISQIIQQALNNQEILLNSGRKKRDYIYIDDVTEAFLKIMEHNFRQKYDIYNLGGGKSYTLKNLAETVVKLAGSKSKIKLHAFPDRVGEADEWLMDLGKIRQEINWEPQVNFAKGLKLTVDFGKNNI